MLPKLGLCSSVPNRNAETEFWVKQKRIALLFCQAKGAKTQDCVSRPGACSEECYRVQGAGHGQLMDIFLIGWW